MTPARIVIVEDDRIVARDIEQQLLAIGHQVVGRTARGEDVWPLVSRAQPDVVLMDIRLEGQMDGIEAAQRVRSHSDVPIVFLTAYTDDETVARASRTGSFGYILKPFDDSQLRIVVEMALYRHEAERRLRESERRYAVTLASIGDAVIAADGNGHVTFVNPIAERLTGWPASEALDMPLSFVFQLADGLTGARVPLPTRASAIADAASRPELIARDGRRTPVDGQCSPIVQGGDASGVVVVFRDITQRNQIEEAKLRASEERFRGTFENAAVGIALCDLDGRHVRVNNRYCDIMKLSREALLDLNFANLAYAGDHGKISACDHNLKRGVSHSYSEELRFVRGDGSLAWVNVTVSMHCNEDGVPVNSIVILLDISVRKQLEDEVRIAKGTLEIRNAELGREIETREQAESALLESLQSVRNANHAIAHDLRTPLTELRARLEMLSLTKPHPDKTFSEIDIAVGNIDRVIGIFNALLRLAEIDAGLRRSGFITVKLADVAADITEFYQPVAELNGVSLELSIDETARVEGDPHLITQALGNLLDNALKYARPYGRVDVRIARTKASACISVDDDGPGVPDHEKPKVVQRFYRGDSSRGTPGIGLGLALVVAVAKLHRGSLDLADNHPGLRATLTLPLIA